MSAKAIREYDGKLLLAYWLLRSSVPFETDTDKAPGFLPPTSKVAQVIFDTSILADATNDSSRTAFNIYVNQILSVLEKIHPWLLTEKVVVKPDQLIKRRGKSGLLLLNADWKQVKEWIVERAGKEIKVN